ncbi:hypothetical protein C0J52_21478 [Blattella germanica]|nr:hypothetical protein C0J52_21478 [Blattella germanica]
MIKFRNFLLGRKHLKSHRFAFELSPKTQPLPSLPGGVYANKIANNYYFRRDARRLLMRPTVLEGDMNGISRKISKKDVCWKIPLPLPGQVHWWDGTPEIYMYSKGKDEKNLKQKY